MEDIDQHLHLVIFWVWDLGPSCLAVPGWRNSHAHVYSSCQVPKLYTAVHALYIVKFADKQVRMLSFYSTWQKAYIDRLWVISWLPSGEWTLETFTRVLPIGMFQQPHALCPWVIVRSWTVMIAIGTGSCDRCWTWHIVAMAVFGCRILYWSRAMVHLYGPQSLKKPSRICPILTGEVWTPNRPSIRENVTVFPYDLNCSWL